MNTFQFIAPQKIVFGWGQRTEIGRLARSLGKRAFVVIGSRTLHRSAVWDEMLSCLETQGVEVQLIASAIHEPTVEDVDELVELMRTLGIGNNSFVIGIGGGSALDLAKAIAAMATNPQAPGVLDFLEGVGTGATIDVPPLPLLVLPTTSGTGSEATKNAVLSVSDPICKKSLRSDQMVPNVVLIDPELTLSLSAEVTAASGMDAITQLIESYISKFAQPIPQAFCIEGLKHALPAMDTLSSDPHNREARQAMSYAALLSGMALANSGLGIAHGVAAALGAYCGVSHGLACAVMLPVALNVNRDVASPRFDQLFRELSNEHNLTTAEAFTWLSGKIASLKSKWSIPCTLSELGVTASQIPLLVAGSKGNSMNGNPRTLSDSELTTILKEML